MSSVPASPSGGGEVARTILVVPFYNEAGRFDAAALEAFAAEDPACDFILVDDGSTDSTLAMLRGLAARDARRFSVVELQPNRGKAEAVRRGMLAAFARAPRYAGYWDADLATPLAELPRFVELLERRPELEIVLGARVLLLGRSIERSSARHYLGRVMATMISRTLGLAVYDTQCGAKLFRVSPGTQALFAEPFVVNWTFDVEIIARLARARRGAGRPGPADVIYELPLRRWRDVPGSKVRPADFLRGMVELLRIRRRYPRG
jgi:glycosyltransferase involved in cell wall biosynthesis